VAPQVTDVAIKGGMKQALLKYAELKAESYQSVKARILSLIQGKSIVGYHLPQKMSDLGLLNAQIGDKPLYDCAKLFNSSEAGPGQQTPITTLCEKYLNLIYKKRPSIG